MALAWIKPDERQANDTVFKADIGVNRYFRYVIGKGRETDLDSMPFIRDIAYSSPIFGRNEEDANLVQTDFDIRIPNDRLKGRELIQLHSFSDTKGSGKTVSDLASLPGQFDYQPDFIYGQSLIFMNSNFNYTRAVPFTFRESPLSTAMFWEALIRTAAQAMPDAIGLIRGLLQNQPQPGELHAAPAGNTAPNTGQTNEIMTRLVDLVQQILSRPPGQSGARANLSGQSSVYAAPARYANSRRTPLSEQKIAPAAIIPLLGSLAPIIGQVAQSSPEILKTLVDSPLNFLQHLMENQLRAEQESKQSDLDLIGRIMADIARNEAMRDVLQGGGAASGLPPADPSSQQQSVRPAPRRFAAQALYRRPGHPSPTNQPVGEIFFMPERPVRINGKPKMVFVTTGPLRLPVMVRSKTGGNMLIQHASIRVELKTISDRKLLLQKKFNYENLRADRPFYPEFTYEEVKGLPSGEDIMVCFSGQYKDEKKRVKQLKSGASLIYFTGPYFFKGLGPAVGIPVELRDKNLYRPFWHKIWEGGSGKERRWELELVAKYYLYYQPKSDSNGRVETRMKLNNPEPGATRKSWKGKIKSGLEVSPEELNKLIPMISSYPLLEDEKLQALKSDDVRRDFNLAGIAQVEMKGRDEEIGMIWAYPEISMTAITLGKTTGTNANGQVTAISEETVYFPRPVSVIFQGEKTVGL